MIPETLGTLFWNCNLLPEHIHQFLPKWVPTFWQEVIYEWFNFMSDTNDCNNISAVAYQIIWCNSYITVDNHPLLYEKYAQKGLMYISDLFTPQGNIQPWMTLFDKYNLKWWDYITIINAVPPNWLKILKGNDISTIPPFEHMCDKVASQSKCVKHRVMLSGGSRISPRRGCQLPGGHQHTILPKFPKNCMKLKEFGPPRRGARPSRPP